MTARRPNVLFLPIDDLRPQLGCYGHPQVVTPNIDTLAVQGTTFGKAYCQVPVCGATRASLLTGVRPLRDRFVTFKTMVEEDLPNALTLPQYFREHGYTTVSVGKVFHHTNDTSERSWSQRPWIPVRDPNESWRNYLLPESLAADNSVTDRGPAFECADVPDNAYADGRIAEQAMVEMRRLAEQDEPFFLAAGFLKPHLPFNAPKKYWDLYDRDELDLAANPYRPKDAPDQAMHNWGELRHYAGIPAEGPLSDEMARSLVHGYNAATSYTDAQIGMLMAELDRLGLRDNTIVVLWGDHGWQLGEHGLWCKHCNFNTSLNAPLIVSALGMKRESKCNALVEFVDVYPTLCELAGLPRPDHLEGTSFVPLMDDPGQPWKRAVFSRYHAGDSIRTDRHLYTEWTDDQGHLTARMLYDHDVDPQETKNLSERPENKDLVARLSNALRSGWQSSGVWAEQSN